jgi:P4 family phage/plasmid primase-like protien
MPDEEAFAMKFFNSLFETEEQTIFFLLKIALYLNGDTSVGAQYLHLYIGSGKNGKSLVMDIFEKVFGNYSATINPTQLSYVNNNPEAASSEKANLVGKRFVRTNEAPSKLKLNASTIKEWTGGDTTTTRQLHKESMEFKPQFHLAYVSNFLPEYDDPSNGVSRRVMIVNFVKEFGEVDDGCRKVKADLTIRDKMITHRMKVAVLKILTKLYIQYFTEERSIVKYIPEEVKQTTNDFIISNNDIQTWFLQNYELGENSEGIQSSNLYKEFEDYYIEKYTKLQDRRKLKDIPSQTTFGKELKDKLNVKQKRKTKGQFYVDIVPLVNNIETDE